jgi:hypothetical protein
MLDGCPLGGLILPIKNKKKVFLVFFWGFFLGFSWFFYIKSAP